MNMDSTKIVQLAVNSQLNNNPFPYDVNECIFAIIQSDGEMKLAAERLKIPVDQLKAIIAVDPNAPILMATHLKALEMLGTFQMVNKLGVVVESKMNDLTPYEAVKAHQGFIKLFSDLAGEQGEHMTGNLPDAVLKLLPPQVREKVLSLMVSPEGARSNTG
jgi:hypothetical protein